jgi:hypothetical protein
MAKITGLAWTTLSVDDSGGTPRDIRNDITSFNFATPRGVQEVTGVDKSAIERLLLLADFSLDLTGVVNTAATTSSHAVLKTVPSTSVARTTTLTVGGATLVGELLFTDYGITRSDKGELTWKSTGVLADGTVPTWS